MLGSLGPHPRFKRSCSSEEQRQAKVFDTVHVLVSLYRMYCFLFQVYCIGTILSMQISFVGFQPVQSSEHMAVSSNSLLSSSRFYQESRQQNSFIHSRIC